MKNKNKEGASARGIRSKLKESLELEGALCKGDSLELFGREYLLIRGCKKILLYTTEEIRLSLCQYVLVIRGKELYCASYYSGAVRVDGLICSLELEEKEMKK